MGDEKELPQGTYNQSFSDDMLKATRARRSKPRMPEVDGSFYGHSKSGKTDKFYKNVGNTTGKKRI